MRYKNYVPHVPQIEVQFEVQIRVHWGKSIQIQKICTTKCGTKTMCHKCHKCGTKCGTIGGIGDKINTRNLTTKKQGASDQKLKINTEKVKTRQLQSFLDENPKIEFFQVKI